MSKLKELRAERARIHNELSQVLAGADSAESREKAKKLIAAMDEKKTQIDAIESKGRSTVGNGLNGDKDVDARRAFSKLCRRGEAALSEDEKALLRENRAIGEGVPIPNVTNTGIGYFVPAGFVYDVEQAMKYYAPFLDDNVFNVIDTATGQTLPHPISNDVTNVASLANENPANEINEADVTAGAINFGAWKYTSGVVRASLELLQDSAFPIEPWLAARFAERFGRKFEADFTNGQGAAASQPNGILTAVIASGVVPVTAKGSSANDGSSSTGANSIGYGDLVALEHSVDPVYRKGASYMLHDQTVSALKQLLDKFGRPLWAPGIDEGEPDRLNGYPIIINQSLPTIAPSATTVLFGEMKKFTVRRVKAFEMLTLRERYAVYGQQGFIAWMRVDSNLLDAGTHPIGYLQQHS